MHENDTPVEGEEATFVVFEDDADANDVADEAPVGDLEVDGVFVDDDDAAAADADDDDAADASDAIGDIAIDGEDADDEANILDKPLDDDEKVAKPLPWLPMLLALLGLAALAGALWFGLNYFKGGEFGNAATVNGKPITIARLNAEMSRIELGNPGVFEEGGYNRDEVRSQILDELINQELLRQKADEEGITIDDEKIDAELQMVKDQYGDKYEETLTQYGYTETELRDQIKMQLTLQALIDKLVPKDTVTDQMVKDYYEQNKAMFVEQAGKRVSHILFDTEDKATAEEVLAKLQAGEGDFAALAKEHSKDTGSAEGGGDLGWGSSDNYVPEFKDAVDKMEKGEMSELVQTEYGWHIIKITDTREEGTMPFDEVAEQIKAMLVNQEQSTLYQNLMTTLKEDAKIEILDPAVLAFREGATAATDGTGAGAQTTDDAAATGTETTE